MINTKRMPAPVGEVLVEEFMKPAGLTHERLSELASISRDDIVAICNSRLGLTADTALILGRVFGNTPEFWINLQRRNDVWGKADSAKQLY